MKSLILPAFTICCVFVTVGGSTSFAEANPAPTGADIPYGPHPHQVMDVYVPPRGAGPFPVVMWFGGLWSPSKNVPDLQRFFDARCAVVGVEMRVMGEAKGAKVDPPVAVCLLDARRAAPVRAAPRRELELRPGTDRRRRGFPGGSARALSRVCGGTCRPQLDRPRRARLHEGRVRGGVAQPTQHRPQTDARMGAAVSSGALRPWATASPSRSEGGTNCCR